MKGLILAAALLATMPGAWARDATGSFETVGAKSCSSFLGDTDVSGAMLWLQNYCKANPSNDLAEGMLALTAELYPRRHRTRQ